MLDIIKRLKNTKYVGSTLWMFLDRFVGLITGLFVGAYVARYLGASQFGILSFATAWIVILSPFYMLGLSSILTRDLVRTGDKRNVLLGSAFFTKLCGAFFVFISVCIFIFCSGNMGESEFVLLIVSSCALFEPFQVIVSYNEATISQRYTAVASIFSQLVRASLQIYLISIHASLIYFAGVMLVERGVRTLFLVYFYRLRVGSIFEWAYSIKIVKTFLYDAWPLLFSGVASVVFLKVDQLMIKGLTSSWDLGVYSAAVKISELFYIFPSIIVPSLFPAIVKARALSKDLYENRVRQLYSLFIVFSVVVIISVIPLSKVVVGILFGPEYSASAVILMVHVCALPFICFMRVAGHSLIVENKQLYLLLNTVVAAALNIGLNLILIPLWSGFGAAIATVISYSVAGSFGFLFFNKSRHLFREQMRAIAMTTPSQIRAIYKMYVKRGE